MSTLKVNNIQTASGGSNSTPEQIEQGRAKAWVNFNGDGTVAIRDSFNVSSITDNGTGDYNVNFTNNMSDANYSVVTGGNFRDTDSAGRVFTPVRSQSASTFNLEVFGDGGGFHDCQRTHAQVMGDQ